MPCPEGGAGQIPYKGKASLGAKAEAIRNLGVPFKRRTSDSLSSGLNYGCYFSAQKLSPKSDSSSVEGISRARSQGSRQPGLSKRRIGQSGVSPHRSSTSSK